MATNYVKARYMEVIDLQTVPDKVSIIGVHTPQGLGPRRHLKGFFEQFRKFKYRGISSLRLASASQLPVDPLQVSGISGTTDVIDPRDMMNPIMFHGCHGDELSNVLDQIFQYSGLGDYGNQFVGNTIDKYDNGIQRTGSSGGEFSNGLESQYYRCLSDPTWKKFGIQQGVQLRGLHPMVNKVALTKQMVPTEAQASIGGAIMRDGDIAPETSNRGTIVGSTEKVPTAINSTFDITWGNAQPNQMFTNGVTPLGWLPTNSFWSAGTAVPGVSGQNIRESPRTFLPKAFMGVLMLPPSYKQIQYMRLIITHEFEFKDFSTSLSNITYDDYIRLSGGYKDLIDHTSSKALAKVSGTLETIDADYDLLTDGVQ